MTSKLNRVYVYGTLMTGEGERASVPGLLYDLGWYPGIKLLKDEPDAPQVRAEVRLVDDKQLERFDAYEGYYPDQESSSLYVRRPFRDGFIYEYNRTPKDEQRIESGDWQDHRARLDARDKISA